MRFLSFYAIVFFPAVILGLKTAFEGYFEYLHKKIIAKTSKGTVKNEHFDTGY